MAVRLLPLSVGELCAHALELQRDCEVRYSDYARHLHALGQHAIAEVFDELGQQARDEVRILETASGNHKPAELSPWEYAWRLTYLPEGTDHRPRLVPMNAREALQMAVTAKRRAQLFYTDVAANANDAVVRECAAEMAESDQVQVKRLERLLASEIMADMRPAAQRTSPGRQPS